VASLASVLIADRPKHEQLLRERHTEMMIVGAEIAKLAGQAHAPVVPVRTGKKTKPNEPCPCGSGKKYKVCCMP
jgi:uncharacterized protein YecA (UPF0149 family)